MGDFASFMYHQTTNSHTQPIRILPTYGRPWPLFLGWTEHPLRPGHWKEAYGVVVDVERGRETPCMRWCGTYKDGRPILRTRLTTYSPIKLWMESHHRHGKITSVCGYKDCVNWAHHTVTPWKSHMDSIRPERDPVSGKYLKKDSLKKERA